MSDHYYVRTGTVGGTLITILGNIAMGDLIKTAVLAAVGAAVSFTLSLLLNRWIKPPKKL